MLCFWQEGTHRSRLQVEAERRQEVDLPQDVPKNTWYSDPEEFYLYNFQGNKPKPYPLELDTGAP